MSNYAPAFRSGTVRALIVNIATGGLTFLLRKFCLLAMCGLAVACLAAAAPAQEPGLPYQREASWAKTLETLRAATLNEPQRLRPLASRRRPAFSFGPTGGGAPQRPETHPLFELWSQLEKDFPLECDWMLQDLAACGYPCSYPARVDHYPMRWFGPAVDADLESRLIRHAIDELGPSGAKFQSYLERLSQSKRPPHTQPWLDLYRLVCQQRRAMRLNRLATQCPSFVFTKHFNMGGSHYAFTEGLSDAQSERHFEPGASLCLLELQSGEPVIRTLLHDSTGVIRDPDVAYSGDRVLFAWKKSDRLDDYHLHEMELNTGRVRQLTFGLGFADYEGAYLPDGDLVFNSTRCVQVVDCFYTEVSNLYTCDRDGRFLRRLAFDQVHSNYPTVSEDGRVIYTRWEYNDRGQVFTQGLFQMNPDGTNQTECYGNNSYFPTAVLHARQVPGTSKIVAIASGHHCPQTGKLILLDPSRGRQENEGAQLIAPVRETAAVRVDRYGQQGALWQYPYPLSESEYLVSYHPWGTAQDPLRFGLYYMTIDGRRELLVSDPDVSCNQPVPLRRPVPHRRPSATNYAKDSGTFYIQDVYAGPGLAGIPRGQAKKLRVIALEFRAAVVGGNFNRGEAGQAFVATPIAVGQGSWEAKTVLGETPICADGSAFFTAPARTPMYFQVIDDAGHMIQTMRSWATLQPGENAACVGCHEHKGGTPMAVRSSEAAQRGPQPLDPFYGPPRGFSFAQEIQPILDQHCTHCHYDRGELAWVSDASTLRRSQDQEPSNSEVAFSLLSRTTTDPAAKRRFSDAYLMLTGAVVGYNDAFEGSSGPLVNWVSPQSGPPMRQPYSAGASQSDLMRLLVEGHAGVRLSREELDRLACWIDLVVPYCGDYLEANSWGPLEKARYQYFVAKRRTMESLEARNIQAMLAEREEINETALDWTYPAASDVLEQGTGAEGTTVEPTVAALSFRAVARAELDAYRNLAENPFDYHESATAFPHASASREPDGTSQTLACAAIDGRDQTDQAIGWRCPSASESGNQRPWWQVDFGRSVQVDKLVITLRSDESDGNGRRRITLVFSDGKRQTIELKNVNTPQTFTFDVRRTSSVRLTDFGFDQSSASCELVECEVWGRDRIQLHEDLSAIGP